MGLANQSIVFAELDLPRERYADQDRRRQFLEAVVERVGAVPGVVGVTPIHVLPFAGATGWDVPRFTAEGQTAEQVVENPSLNFEAVHPTYFTTLNVPIVRGRAFRSRTARGAARRHRQRRGRRPCLAAAGSDRQAPEDGRTRLWQRVADNRRSGRDDTLSRTGRPAADALRAGRAVHDRGRQSRHPDVDRAALLAGAVRDSVRAVDPAVQVRRVAPFSDYQQRPLAWPRFNALLLGVFAIAAWLLSSIGLYGVMAASVRRRRGEIGVRVALGATAADVRRLVLGESLRMAVAGVTVGLALALMATRVLRSLLFGVQPFDPSTLLAAAAALIAASLLASYLPPDARPRLIPSTRCERNEIARVEGGKNDASACQSRATRFV